jgi:hypothetical protein
MPSRRLSNSVIADLKFNSAYGHLATNDRAISLGFGPGSAANFTPPQPRNSPAKPMDSHEV